jgi:hypothetical protein
MYIHISAYCTLTLLVFLKNCFLFCGVSLLFYRDWNMLWNSNKYFVRRNFTVLFALNTQYGAQTFSCFLFTYGFGRCIYFWVILWAMLQIRYFLVYFPYFKKIKVCLCDLRVSLNPTYLHLNVWTNLYETWYVYNGHWAHLNGVLHKSLPSVCITLLGNDLVDMLPRQWTHATI